MTFALRAARLMAAYGEDGDSARLESSLGAIAWALNKGDLAYAAMVAVLTRSSELNRESAERLARADEELAKYDPDQPRDWHGRWTLDGDVLTWVAGAVAPQAAEVEPQVAVRPTPPALSPAPDRGAAQDHAREPTSVEQALEQNTTIWGQSISPRRSCSLAAP